ncbi:MAG: SDR family NAD(P)-dependent oxidoreductase, partial [Cyanobacteria bacterium P01_F01_bin.150]
MTIKNFSNLIELLNYRAIYHPQRTAYIYLQDGEIESDQLRYQDLKQQAQAIASQLLQIAQPGERVLLLYPPGLEFVTALFGCLYAGIIAVPANPPRRRQRRSRLGAIANDAQPTVVLTTTNIWQQLQKQSRDYPKITRLAVLITEDVKYSQGLTSLTAPVANPDTLAFLQYTSGSTGQPKGVRVSHGNVLHNCKLIQSVAHTSATSRLVSWLPVYHDMGLINSIFQPLYVGCQSIIMSPTAFLQKPVRWLQAISKFRGTHGGAPDFAYQLCVQKIRPEQKAELDLSSWAVAYNGAEPIRAHIMAEFAAAFKECGFQQRAFMPCYGLAEATLGVSWHPIDQVPKALTVSTSSLTAGQIEVVVETSFPQPRTQSLVSCGIPPTELNVRIVNPSTGQCCVEGEIGEIWLAGKSVTQGYWSQSDATQLTFQAYLEGREEGPFLRTGDLGGLVAGELIITGRLKDLIIIRGQNYYPQDIEQVAAASHPALQPGEGAAFSIELGEQAQLIVVHELKRSYLRQLNGTEVINAVRRAISGTFDLQVQSVVLLKPNSILKTSSGKIQRRACRSAFLNGSLAAVAHEEFKGVNETQAVVASQVEQPKSVPTIQDNSSHPTASQIYQWLVTQLAQYLNLEPGQISGDRPLAEYGLNSATAVGVSGELQEWLQRPLSVTLLYDYPTLAALSEYLGEPTSEMGNSPTQHRESKALTETVTDAIAIIGIGCRFPNNINNAEDFWQLLRDADDVITTVPSTRWAVDNCPDATHYGGFLEQVDRFDASFFGISPREAISLDPQQRLLLEVSWEAIEDSIQAPSQLLGKDIGVFIGISTHDYTRLLEQAGEVGPYFGTGNASSTAAGRLSYSLGLTGPSVAIDTACSSSLVAVHNACQSLRLGECEQALAGGVNLILTAENSVALAEAHMLTDDGRCKTFDAEANGYVRGEGCGVIVLKRLSDALRDGDPIRAIIRGSAVNQDGRSNGLTAPSGLAQQQVIQAALLDAGVMPADIDYIEAHGTGTALGDPIELTAIQAVMAAGRPSEQTVDRTAGRDQQPLWVGSVKTNLGHLEAAAGIAGMIKVVQSFHHGQIPAHLHLQQPTPHFDWNGLQVPIQTRPWPERNDGARKAGVSSFGFSGTNAHVVLEAVSEKPLSTEIPDTDRPLHLLGLSAATPAALSELCQKYCNYLETHPEINLADLCFSANTGRSHFRQRLVLAVSSVPDLVEQLRINIKAIAGTAEIGSNVGVQQTPKVTFLFTGQGSQHAEMGQELYETQPLFRQILDHCNNSLRPYLNLDILQILYPNLSSPTPSLSHSPTLLDQTAYTQPILFALEYALSQLWLSWGITPTAVMGHSIGEIVAACIAGVFSLEDGLKLSAIRGRLMQQLPAGGSMVSIMASVDLVRPLIVGRDNVTIAAINGPESTVISGELSAVRQIAQQLEQQGIKTKQLKVSHAFHSSLMAPMLVEFEQVVRQISYALPQLKLISNVTGQEATKEIATPDYWIRHILAPVNFAAGIDTLYQEGTDIFLECGPQPILLGMARQCLPENEEKIWLPSLRSNQNDWQQMLSSVAQLYGQGVEIDWGSFDKDYPQRRKVSLPTYPFQRQRYWIDITKQRALPGQAVHPLLGFKTELAGGETLYSQQFDAQEGWLADHQVYQTTMMPGAGFAAMALASQQGPTQLQAVVFERPMIVSEPCELQLRLAEVADSEQQRFTIYSRRTSARAETWQLHSYGLINPASSTSDILDDVLDIELIRSRLQPRSVDQMYEQIGAMGLELGPAFRGLQQLWVGTNEALAKVILPKTLATAIEPIHPAMLDACTQTLFGAMDGPLDEILYLPLQYRQLELYRPVPSHLFCYAQTVEVDVTAQTVTSHLTFVDEQGEVFGKLEGFVIKRAAHDAMLREFVQPARHLLYKTEWQPAVLEEAVSLEIATGSWIILGEAAVCADLGEQLGAHAQSVLCGSPGQFTELLNEWSAAGSMDQASNVALAGIVLVSAVNTGDIASETELNANHVLQVVQTLLAQDIHLPQGLILITQQAMAVESAADVILSQAALWGLGRALQVEQPQLGIRLLDVNSLETVSLSAGLLNSTESQWVLRGEQSFVPRLTRAQLDAFKSLTIRVEGSYLITGGLGALGLHACEWLLTQGVQHVVLSSRREADETTRKRIVTLEQSYGSRIVVCPVDVTDAAQVRGLIGCFGQDWPTLAGVVHAAGVLDDGIISEQTKERYAQVLGPKVQGAWHLHQATVNQTLDFFVLYSSVTATLGASGQSSYAMANAFLNGLAQHRRAQGICATSINWGPWADAGMTNDATVRANLARQGLTPLQPQDAHDAMAQILAADTSNGVVLDVNWNRMGRYLGDVRPPLLSQLLPQASFIHGSELLQQLQNALPIERAALLLRHLQRELQQILGLTQPPNPDIGFFDLGMDSLMAVELRNRLQQELGNAYSVSNTLAFDYPTINRLATHLTEQLGALPVAPTKQKSAIDRSLETDAVAIVGLACRFPGAPDKEAYWQLLTDGMDAIREVPPERWDIDAYYDPDPDAPGKMTTRYGGFIDGIDQFDASFFGIAPREAIELDPQQRLLLEMSWQALEDANIPPVSLVGSQTGVYIGISTSDYAQLIARGGEQAIGQYMGTGNAASAAVGRLSYVLGLEGPSLAIDTACSSSLVALHQAARGLLNGDCELALVGGVNAILSPENTIYFSKGRFMAPDGRCKTFDESADGYVRGEGCGMVVLKRLSEAERDGDRIYGVIRGSAVNQDGASGGLTVPNGPAQQRVIRQALAMANLEPADVAYVEAHGTGTSLGDPIEIQALQQVLGQGHSPEQPLWVGSVKTNIGHLEAAAGIASVIKVALSFQHGLIPGQLHFHKPSPRIPWDDINIQVADTAQPWPTNRRIAGVSGFAFQGTNAHVVLEGYRQSPLVDVSHPEQVDNNDVEQGLRLLPISGKSEAAVQALAAAYADWLGAQNDINLNNLCFTAGVGRNHFGYRATVVGQTQTQLLEKLQQIATDTVLVQRIQQQNQVAVLFTGQGSQYVNMAQELYGTQPTFRRTLDQCSEILNTDLERPLLDILYPSEGTTQDALLHQTAYTQPALFAIEYALYQLWCSWGITPAVVMGHSIGEIVAACVAGVFSLEDGLKLSAMRGKLMGQLPSGGAMASVMASVEQVRPILSDRDNVTIAAINGPESTVISGEASGVQAVVQQLENQDIKTKQLSVSHAFHSPLMEPMLVEFEQVTRQISYGEPKLKLISTVTGQVVCEAVATPDYWSRHILASVNFAAGIETLYQQGIDIILECGPQPILLGLARHCLLGRDEEKVWLPSLRPGQSDWQQMLSSLSQLYIRGVNIDWMGCDQDSPQCRTVDLPTYPFQRQRYWIDIPQQRVSMSSNSSQVTELLAQGDVSQLQQLLPIQTQMPIATETIEQLVKVHQQQLATHSIQDLLYEIQWQRQAAPAIGEHQPHHWLIVAKADELGREIANQLHNHGQTSTLVSLVSALPQEDKQDSYTLQPDSPEAFTRLWTHLGQTNTLPIAGILWLQSLEEINSTDLTTDVLDRTVNQQCTELLHLMQSLVAQPALSQTRLWVLTQNGVALETDQPALVQAPVRGMGRIFGLEHPHQWGGLIDLDSQAMIEHQAQWLTTEVLTNHTEEQVAYRKHQRYVARLVRTQPKPDTPLTIDPESSYLLSGGLGGLGLTVAQWLVEQGARYLVLLSRQGANTPEKEAAIARLRSQGCQVVMPVVDINDAMALQITLSPLFESCPPIRGVIHAAGIDGGLHPIESLNQATLAKTLAPKVKGSWNLHQLSLDWNLDFFVNFSSIAAVWGSAHQAHYGAANEFQNLLSQYRQSQGLPGLTVNWSAIAGTGMVSQADTSQVKRLSEIGITSLSLPQMTAALRRLLSTPAQQCVVAAVDWQQFNAVYQTGRHRGLLEPLVTPESLASKPPVQTDWMEQILSLSSVEQLEHLKHTVQQEVAHVLGLSSTSLPDPQVGFFELGMDSLMAVDLRSRLTQLLGVTLPATVAFDFPNIEQLSRYLASEVLELTAQFQGKTTLPPQRQTLDEPIAIVGMGCRLPGGINSPEQFWQLLQTGEDAHSEIPAERWDIDAYYDPDPEATGKMLTRYGHFIEAVDQFDPSFFGISPREAVAMDPQHRLLLEVSWEALERAGQKLERLSEAVVGIFVGNDGHDYEQLLQQHLQQSPDSPLATYAGSGNHISSAAGRLAYTLGFTGPTITLDTACSSSLVAVHQACNSIRLGECSMALAGGVKLHLTPDSYIGTSRARMISTDGRCKTFDQTADGYGRGEGCGIIVLKRLSDAERDGDPILALIRGSAVNQDGPSSGLTVPNGQAQQRLIKQALAQAQVQPTEVSYLEAHGTGTCLGDPIEVNAAMAVLGEERSATQPLWIGSVKTNIGHLEAAAGISGLIKVVLSLQHQQIPAHLHLNTPNPKIDWQDWLQVPQALTPWPSPGQRLAGVSAFGFTGTNAHVVLAEAPKSTEIVQTPVDRPSHVLAISAKTEESLAQLAQSYREYLESHPQQLLADVCFSANTGRLAHGHRLAVVADTGTMAAVQLSTFTAEKMQSGLVKGVLKTAELPKVAILFTGQGSQYVNMARELYESQPTFRQTLDRCCEILNTYLDRPLLEILYPDESIEQTDALLNQTAYTQPALFAIEHAIYQLWHSWGIAPSVVMGHSIGELVAACVAGVFSLEDGLKLSAIRGKLMQQLPTRGAMVSVMASVERLSPFITGNVTIAAINGPESTVISGEESAVLDIAQQLEAQGIKTKQLQVSHAFHSPLMEPMLHEFEQVTGQISYSQPQLKLISNVTGQIVTEEVTTPDYWCRHVLSTVNFAAGMERLRQEEINIFLECGPQPILLGMGRQCLPEDNEKTWLPSLRPNQNDWQQMLSSLGQLYVRGVKINWIGFDQDYSQRRKIALPTYPFQRQRYWIDLPKHRSLIGQPSYGLVGNKLELASTGQTIYHQIINLTQYPWINDHRVYDTAVIPGVSYIAMTLATLALPATVDSVRFLEPLFLASPNSERETELVVQPSEEMASRQVDVFSRDATQTDQWRQHASLTVQDAPQLFSPLYVDIAHLQAQLDPIAADTLHQLYDSISVTYGPMLTAVKQAWVGNGIALSEIMMPESLDSPIANEPIHPVLLDACTRLTADLFEVDHEPGVFWAPWQVDRVTLMRPAPRRFYAYVDQATRINEQLQTHAYDIYLLDETGHAFGRIDGFTVKRAPRERFLKYLQVDTNQWLYQLQWQASELQSQAALPEAGTWLLLVPTAQWAERLKETLLVNQGQSCVVVSLGATFRQLDNHHYQVCPTQNDGFERLFQQLDQQGIALQGIVHLWSLASHIEDLTDSLKITCGTTLQLLQALISQEESPALWLVTQGSQHLDREQIPQIQQTPLWGLGRVIALEHPELRCHLLDLEEESAIAEAVQLLVQEVLSADAENLVAYNQNQRYVARLKPYTAEVETALASSQENWVQPDASYLITGGLGALGLQVAQWLKQSGATSLVLMGRRAPSETAAAMIHDLRQSGVTVSVVQADVANAVDVARVLDDINSQLPPLKGIIHAAGVLADGLLQNQSWSQFEQVMAAKVLGSWHLHQLTQKSPLDFFVCFSSAASLLGSLGQGNYAAANAFMDGLAHYRRAQGLPCLSINWGPWAGDGMAAQLSHPQLSRFEKAGFQPLDFEQGLSILQQCLQLDMPQVGVLPINWSQWSDQGTTATQIPLLKAVLPNSSRSSQTGWLRRQLEAVPMEQRRALLMDQVRLQVAQILGITDSTTLDDHTGLFDMGIDSLMILELNNRLQACLGCQLSATDLFDYNTLDDLVNYLVQDVLQWSEENLESQRQTSAEASRRDMAASDSAAHYSTEPIAIIGLGCRFPQAINPADFWQLLEQGTDAVTEVPADRWDIDQYYDPDPDVPGKMYTRYGSFLSDVDQFDAAFFKISPREARSLDPQHRLLLEVCWESLEDAGVSPLSLKGTQTGVFIGMMTHDYGQLAGQAVDVHTGSGNGAPLAAGRIAYTLGLSGPTLTVETACSSSLVACHLACQSLRNHESNLALVGGVNLMLTPGMSVLEAQAQMNSPDGRCKTFDDSADGYGRGEGCGIVVLKRLSDAQADGDQILALVRGSAVNHDGSSSGLTVPNGLAQKTLIEQALTNANVQATQVDYVECHGTGTALGDPIEINSLVKAYGKHRDQFSPIMIGSVKTNIGHTEGAAGIAGLIKVILSLQHEKIPPHLHLEQPNRRIAWDQIPVAVPTKVQSWQRRDKSRLAGISSFGLSGTNAHVIVEESPATVPMSNPMERPWHMLTLAAKTEAALQDLVGQYETYISHHPELTLADICYTVNTGRAHFKTRLAVAGTSLVEVSEQLKQLRESSQRDGLRLGQFSNSKSSRLAMLFTGQGAQSVNMARELYETQPTFKHSLDQCSEILNAYLEKPLLDVLYPDQDNVPDKDQDNVLHQTAYTQPALFAIEYALYQLWQSWGIKPSVVMGHSIGEIVAACVAGVFSLEDGLKLAAMRGQLMQQLSAGGAMASVMASTEQVNKRLVENVTIAAINGPESTVISGEESAVLAIAQQLEA